MDQQEPTKEQRLEFFKTAAKLLGIPIALLAAWSFYYVLNPSNRTSMPNSKKETSKLEQKISVLNRFSPIKQLRYGGTILLEDTVVVETMLNPNVYGRLETAAKNNKYIGGIIRFHIDNICDFLNGNLPVLNKGSEYEGYDLPFRLALYASANAQRVEGRFLEGNRNWKTREYTITPNGEPPKDPKKRQTCTFVDAPGNSEVGEHLIFKGKYTINGKERNLVGFYNIQEPLKSWVYFNGIEDNDFIYNLNRVISQSDPRIVGQQAVDVLKILIEFYRSSIIKQLESKSAQILPN